MQTVNRDGVAETSLSLYRDELATSEDFDKAVMTLMAVFRHEKDANFWAIVQKTLREQRPTRKRLNDIVSRASDAEYLTIGILKHDKRIRMYSQHQAIEWFNRNVSGSEKNHMLLYFYAYPKDLTGGERFYSLWSDMALNGINVAPLKDAQAKQWNYELK